jgi:NAD(P)-dependent dehydrogenase (short-subunit alcohol dehydrogenase family)
MQGEIILFTGASSGLGKVAAIEAAGNGAILVAVVRNIEKGYSLVDEFEKKYKNSNGRIDLIEGNLNSLDSIVDLCKAVSSTYDRLDIIVNNAGLMNFEPVVTVNGIEETLQVNLISPFLILQSLLPLLEKAKSPKVIFTASALHQGLINFGNIQFIEEYSGFKVYRQSKLGVILLTRFLALRYPQIGMYSQHPGIVDTELSRSAGWLSKLIFKWMGKTPEQGAKTLNYLIETNNYSLVSGEYYANSKVKETTKEAYDLEAAKRLVSVLNGYLENYLPKSQLLSVE